MIASADSADDVAQILYGLSIRGVRAVAVEQGRRLGDHYLIVLESPAPMQVRVARESIHAIWDAILEGHPRATTPDGRCAFCGYAVAGLPIPATCPECGAELDSIESRRKLRGRHGLL